MTSRNAPSSPLEFIRREVFKCKSQSEFARLLGVSQKQISLLEGGKRRTVHALLFHIRSEAKRLNLDLDDRFFFEIPQVEPTQERALESA